MGARTIFFAPLILGLVSCGLGSSNINPDAPTADLSRRNFSTIPNREDHAADRTLLDKEVRNELAKRPPSEIPTAYDYAISLYRKSGKHKEYLKNLEKSRNAILFYNKWSSSILGDVNKQLDVLLGEKEKELLSSVVIEIETRTNNIEFFFADFLWMEKPTIVIPAAGAAIIDQVHFSHMFSVGYKNRAYFHRYSKQVATTVFQNVLRFKAALKDVTQAAVIKPASMKASPSFFRSIGVSDVDSMRFMKHPPFVKGRERLFASAISFSILHELAHYLLRHGPRVAAVARDDRLSMSRLVENEADEWAAIMMLKGRVGWPPQVVPLLLFIAHLQESGMIPKEKHRDQSERIKNVYNVTEKFLEENDPPSKKYKESILRNRIADIAEVQSVKDYYTNNR